MSHSLPPIIKNNNKRRMTSTEKQEIALKLKKEKLIHQTKMDLVKRVVLEKKQKYSSAINYSFVNNFYSPETLEIKDFKIEHVADLHPEVANVNNYDAVQIIIDFEKRKNARIDRIVEEKQKNFGINPHKIEIKSRLDNIKSYLKSKKKYYMKRAEFDLRNASKERENKTQSSRILDMSFDPTKAQKVFEDPQAYYNIQKFRYQSRATRFDTEAQMYLENRQKLAKVVENKINRSPSILPILENNSLFREKSVKPNWNEEASRIESSKIESVREVESVGNDIIEGSDKSEDEGFNYEEEQKDLTKKIVQEIKAKAPPLLKKLVKKKKKKKESMEEIKEQSSSAIVRKRAIAKLKGMLAMFGAKNLRKQLLAAEKLNAKKYTFPELINEIKTYNNDAEKFAKEITSKNKNYQRHLKYMNNSYEILEGISNSEPQNIFYNYLYSVKSTIDTDMELNDLKKALHQKNGSY